MSIILAHNDRLPALVERTVMSVLSRYTIRVRMKGLTSLTQITELLIGARHIRACIGRRMDLAREKKRMTGDISLFQDRANFRCVICLQPVV
jgi:hypothetical protein